MESTMRKSIIVTLIVLVSAIAIPFYFSKTSVKVEDKTANPASESYSSFNYGFDINAEVTTKGSLSKPTIHTTVKVEIPNATPAEYYINMQRSDLTDDTFSFAGRVNTGLYMVRVMANCGYEVKHKATANLLGLLFYTDETSTTINGKDDFLSVQWIYSAERAPAMDGTFDVTFPAQPASYGVLVQNFYSTPLTISDVTCTTSTGATCSADPASPVTNINYLNIGTSSNIGCGGTGGIQFKCTNAAVKNNQGATVAFTTSRGKITAPFICEEEPGA